MQTHRFASHCRTILPLACSLLVAAIFGASPARAAGVVGTGTPASCTRSAFNAALVGGGTVTFNCGPQPHTIQLTRARRISLDTEINGGNRITLEASGSNHFEVLSGGTLVLVNLRLTGGHAEIGGAIVNQGTTRTNGVTFADNRSTMAGGAIVNRGTLVARRSTFSNNQSITGGAIWNDGGTVQVDNSSFNGNRATGDGNSPGGAIANSMGSLSVVRSTFTDNAADLGGALENEAEATVESSIFSGNEARNGGAISNAGQLTVDRCSLEGNLADSGGGIYHFGVMLTLTASTLNANLAFSGGGIYATGNAAYTNSTLSGNQANEFGGGLYQNRGDGKMLYTTVANNFATAGAGVFKGSVPGSLSLQNTLLANNSSGNCDGERPMSLGNNLSTDTNCDLTIMPSDQQGVDAKLGPLANNGGPTRTHLPQSGSPAINAAARVSVTVDQRGITRPQRTEPDIGSVEVQ